MFLFGKTRTSGFVLAEVVVAISLVAFAVLIVGGLGQQVLNLVKSSRQAGALADIRNKSHAINRNLDTWIERMRSSSLTQGLYAACLPDPAAATSVFKCPAVNDSLISADTDLSRYAGTQLHAVSAPIVDLMGDLIAGTEDHPVYFDLDGRLCDAANSNNHCPIRSRGYFLRTNADTSSNPGSVRFIVKVDANPNHKSSGGTPIRGQSFSIDLGNEWHEASNTCPEGFLKIGYIANGQANCVKPTARCSKGIQLGVDSSGAPICKDPSLLSCNGGSIIVDQSSGELACSSVASPCDSNLVFVGYYAGSGEPICLGESSDSICGENSVQVGIENQTAVCRTLPSCLDSQKLSYDGSKFVCESASVVSECAEGEVVVGINEDGTAKCQSAERNLVSTNLSCPDGQYVSALRPDGSVVCKSLASVAPPSTVGYTGPLWKCTCGGYMNIVTTQNLIYGETCVFGNGGTANNVQYASWSCTQLQSGTASLPNDEYDTSCGYSTETTPYTWGCCRTKVNTGETSCKWTNTGLNWQATNPPWPTPTSGKFKISCNYESKGGSFNQWTCCRTNTLTGNVDCKGSTDSTNWTTYSSPW